MAAKEIVHAQDFIRCSCCEQNVTFFCKTCKMDLCEECVLEHTREKEEDCSHQVVIYSQKYKCDSKESCVSGQNIEVFVEDKLTLIEEKIISGRNVEISEMCSIHPSMTYGVCCKECKVPVCIRCIKEKHNGHVFIEIKEFYEMIKEEIERCVFDMNSSKIPQTQGFLDHAIQGRMDCIVDIEKVKSQLASDAERAKKLLDESLASGLKVINDIQIMLTADYIQRENDIKGKVSDLQCAVRYYNEMKTSNKFAEMVNFHTSLQNNPIRCSKALVSKMNYNSNKSLTLEEVSKLFGCITVKPGSVNELRRLKEVALKKGQIQFEFTPVVERVLSFEVSGISHTSHISYVRDGMAFFSDNNSSLVLANSRGEMVKEKAVMVSSGYGCHAVTIEKDLLIIDLPKHQIYKVTQEKKSIPLINTGKWTPTTLHCSTRNGDILIGMYFKHDARIVRYDDKGRELCDSQRDANGVNLYRNPCYITENINRDICVSDWNGECLIVTDRSGKHKFSYSGSGSRFYPRGIATDDTGRIYVLDGWSDAVHVLGADGKQLALISTEDHGVEGLLSICFGAKGNLWIGNRLNNIIAVIKVTLE
ncbi:uncharacterized protein LOC133175658 [Saccostrea echinata]|uniref:uncharacterized protein LOC133175658 n=1 Tax=Saccostrea echinata TaxID=191078 RepID=UPI002A808BB7|nr:uncharacterized protein LOC133175658 [Saccostrea echinata]